MLFFSLLAISHIFLILSVSHRIASGFAEAPGRSLTGYPVDVQQICAIIVYGGLTKS